MSNDDGRTAAEIAQAMQHADSCIQTWGGGPRGVASKNKPLVEQPVPSVREPVLHVTSVEKVYADALAANKKNADRGL